MSNKENVFYFSHQTRIGIKRLLSLKDGLYLVLTKVFE